MFRLEGFEFAGPGGQVIVELRICLGEGGEGTFGFGEVLVVLRGHLLGNVAWLGAWEYLEKIAHAKKDYLLFPSQLLGQILGALESPRIHLALLSKG